MEVGQSGALDYVAGADQAAVVAGGATGTAHVLGTDSAAAAVMVACGVAVLAAGGAPAATGGLAAAGVGDVGSSGGGGGVAERGGTVLPRRPSRCYQDYHGHGRRRTGCRGRSGGSGKQSSLLSVPFVLLFLGVTCRTVHSPVIYALGHPCGVELRGDHPRDKRGRFQREAISMRHGGSYSSPSQTGGYRTPRRCHPRPRIDGGGGRAICTRLGHRRSAAGMTNDPAGGPRPTRPRRRSPGDRDGPRALAERAPSIHQIVMYLVAPPMAGDDGAAAASRLPRRVDCRFVGGERMSAARCPWCRQMAWRRSPPPPTPSTRAPLASTTSFLRWSRAAAV